MKLRSMADDPFGAVLKELSHRSASDSLAGETKKALDSGESAILDAVLEDTKEVKVEVEKDEKDAVEMEKKAANGGGEGEEEEEEKGAQVSFLSTAFTLTTILVFWGVVTGGLYYISYYPDFWHLDTHPGAPAPAPAQGSDSSSNSSNSSANSSFNSLEGGHPPDDGKTPPPTPSSTTQ